MLYTEHVLCVAASASAALRWAASLANHLGATLHVVPHPSAQKGTDAREGQPVWASPNVADVPLRVPDPLPQSTPALLRYVTDAEIDLVVGDPSPAPATTPLLAAGAMQTLVRQLDRPVLVPQPAEQPTGLHDILVSTDLSMPALRAFRHALSVARLYDAAVHVLHVVDSLPYVALTPMDRLSLGVRPLSEYRGRRRLQAFVAEGTAADVPVHPRLEYGDVAGRIVQAIDQHDIDLLVLAAHGSGAPTSDAAFGTVTEHVLERVCCSVFLLPTVDASLLAHPVDDEPPPPSS